MRRPAIVMQLPHPIITVPNGSELYLEALPRPATGAFLFEPPQLAALFISAALATAIDPHAGY